MDINILANEGFGWSFVIGEIVLLYLTFLFIHRIVEKRLKGK